MNKVAPSPYPEVGNRVDDRRDDVIKVAPAPYPEVGNRVDDRRDDVIKVVTAPFPEAGNRADDRRDDDFIACCSNFWDCCTQSMKVVQRCLDIVKCITCSCD